MFSDTYPRLLCFEQPFVSIHFSCGMIAHSVNTTVNSESASFSLCFFWDFMILFTFQSRRTLSWNSVLAMISASKKKKKNMLQEVSSKEYVWNCVYHGGAQCSVWCFLVSWWSYHRKFNETSEHLQWFNQKIKNTFRLLKQKCCWAVTLSAFKL